MNTKLSPSGRVILCNDVATAHDLKEWIACSRLSVSGVDRLRNETRVSNGCKCELARGSSYQGFELSRVRVIKGSSY